MKIEEERFYDLDEWKERMTELGVRFRLLPAPEGKPEFWGSLNPGEEELRMELAVPNGYFYLGRGFICTSITP